MQVVDNQLGHDNSPKLERIVQSLEDNPTDENERKTILTAASSNLLEATKNLPELYQEGFQVTTVSNLASLKGVNLTNNQVYHSFK